MSGLTIWVTAETASTGDPAVTKMLVDLGFATGAAGFVVPFALLIAGVAVPGIILGLLPRPLAVIGLGLAAVGMISTFTLVTSTLDITLPIVRFAGLAWILAVAAILPAHRHNIAK
jgi:hypothetical protein